MHLNATMENKLSVLHTHFIPSTDRLSLWCHTVTPGARIEHIITMIMESCVRFSPDGQALYHRNRSFLSPADGRRFASPICWSYPAFCRQSQPDRIPGKRRSTRRKC